MLDSVGPNRILPISWETTEFIPRPRSMTFFADPAPWRPHWPKVQFWTDRFGAILSAMAPQGCTARRDGSRLKFRAFNCSLSPEW
jgi:hypothetical protein